RLPRAVPAAVFLVRALVLVGRLAYQAQDAEGQHRRTTESVLRDYARLAAAEYARRMNMLDSYGCEPALRPLRRAIETHAAIPVPTNQEVIESATARRSLRMARFHFVLQMVSEGEPAALATYGGDPGPRVRAWLSDTLRAQCRGTYQTGWDHALVFGSLDGEDHALTYSQLHDSTGTLIALYGFETSREALDY